MPQANVIRWRDGAGWLVLSGGGDIESAEVGEIEAEALARVPAGDPVAYIWAATDVETADKHLTALEDLGAPTGFLVDVLTEDDATLREQLAVVGMVIIEDGPNVTELRSGLLGAALEGINAAYERGAVIVPHYDAEVESVRMRDLLTAHPQSYGLGIGTGSALALGPNGEVIAWGKQQVTVALNSSAAKESI